MDLSSSLLDRLLLTEERIEQIVDGVRQLIDLEDPIGETIEAWERPNGYKLKRFVYRLVSLGWYMKLVQM